MSQKKQKGQVDAKRRRPTHADVEKMVAEAVALYHTTIEDRLLPRTLGRHLALGHMRLQLHWRVTLRSWWRWLTRPIRARNHRKRVQAAEEKMRADLEEIRKMAEEG